VTTIDSLRTAFYRVPPLPQPTGLTYGGAGNNEAFTVTIPVASRIIAALSNPDDLILRGAIENAQMPHLLSDFNDKTAGIARALKTLDIQSDSHGTTLLLFRDAYPGISGKMIFQGLFDENTVAVRKDYADIQSRISADSAGCAR
jgi:hypothetical protein